MFSKNKKQKVKTPTFARLLHRPFLNMNNNNSYTITKTPYHNAAIIFNINPAKHTPPPHNYSSYLGKVDAL